MWSQYKVAYFSLNSVKSSKCIIGHNPFTGNDPGDSNVLNIADRYIYINQLLYGKNTNDILENLMLPHTCVLTHEYVKNVFTHSRYPTKMPKVPCIYY